MSERPILFAMASGALAFLLTASMLFWATRDPESVVIGLPGRHDAPYDTTARLADCLDCHVPFVGTPGSRCLGPGCHGELATGTPPKDGPAMPIRFHAALRDTACTRCHEEHAKERPERIFSHALIPKEPRSHCSLCHSGRNVKGHARTDAISCDVCHGFDQFEKTEMDHERVVDHPCDVCHVAPKDEAHASVAGACTDCHDSESWQPRDHW